MTLIQPMRLRFWQSSRVITFTCMMASPFVAGCDYRYCNQSARSSTANNLNPLRIVGIASWGTDQHHREASSQRGKDIFSCGGGTGALIDALDWPNTSHGLLSEELLI